ncbi:DUF192 domain-containing protein [Sulfitobacter sp. S190]|uniref:DUF192 domain-containing protein n=1 Tax=Sulfitobacter sp. S190 TaxID=2867022 RepID=UPI0021A4ABDF|nr:DUF192 domain-containing protein [Sulfitobacter sp. S190]
MVFALVLVTQGAAAQNCNPDRVVITGDFGTAQFSVDVADDDASRAQGLMHVENMPLSRGMLFVYDTPQRMAFWMRNTLIELDMLFVDGTGEIRHIHARAQPLDETVISGGPEELSAVLEINGGLAARLGIDVGDRLQHPAFADGADGQGCAKIAE